MATPIARSGKNCQIRISGSILVCDEWTASPYGDDVDVTCSEYQGGISTIDGCEGVKIKIKGFFDGQINPYDSTLALKRGHNTKTMTCYATGTSSGVNWVLTQFYVASCEMSAKVRGRVDFDCEVLSQGPQDTTMTAPNGSPWGWSFPTGAFGLSS